MNNINKTGVLKVNLNEMKIPLSAALDAIQNLIKNLRK